MPVQNGAQRASSHRSTRSIVLGLAFALTAAVGLANPVPAAASGLKVVIIVGPVESNTANYIASAKRYAAQARSYFQTPPALSAASRRACSASGVQKQ